MTRRHSYCRSSPHSHQKLPPEYGVLLHLLEHLVRQCFHQYVLRLLLGIVWSEVSSVIVI